MRFALELTMTCSACPVQFEGSCNGVPFYYRARWGRWSILEIDVNACTPEQYAAAVPVAEGELEGGEYDTGTVEDALERIRAWALTHLGD